MSGCNYYNIFCDTTESHKTFKRTIVIGLKTIQDRIAEIQCLIKQDELERIKVAESQEENICYYYTYDIDKFTLPWSNYVGFFWQDEYFENNKDEAMKTYAQSQEYIHMDISEWFPNYVEFTIDDLLFQYNIDTADIGVSPAIKVSDKEVTVSGYHIKLSGRIFSDDSYKSIFETRKYFD